MGRQVAKAQMADCNDPGNYSISTDDYLSYNASSNTYTIYADAVIQFTSEGVNPDASSDPLFTNPGLILGVFTCYPVSANLNETECLLGAVPGLVDSGTFTLQYLGEEAGSSFVLIPIINPNIEGNVLLKSSCTGISMETIYPTFIIVDPFDCLGIENGTALPGTSCDDNDACTINDIYTPDCNCAGIFVDEDEDTVCAAEDCDDNNPDLPIAVGTPCDDGNPLSYDDMIGEDGCTCTGIICELTGTSCNDNDECTINDMYDVYCLCSGMATEDIDNDGICGAIDCDDNNPDLPTTPGTGCDDNDMQTENDIYLSDGCTCAGTPISDPCADLGGDEDGDGVCASDDCAPQNPFYPSIPGTLCDDNNPSTINDIVGNDGCSCAGTPIDDCLDFGGDVDNDGICADFDCNDLDPLQGTMLSPGTVCNDNNELSFNDVILSNGCTCAGTVCNNAGWACNDGDECTINDIIDATCSCTGIPTPDNDGDGLCNATDCNDNNPNLPALPGTFCDDNNPTTIDDIIQSDGCICAGISICSEQGGDADADGVCAIVDCDDQNPNAGMIQEPGTACNDNNVQTEGDIIQEDGCTCSGILIVLCTDITGHQGLPGQSCDDGNICTSGDVFDLDCVCMGIIIDMDGDGICGAEDCDDNDPNSGAIQLPGTTCNDGDPTTFNDAYLEDGCTCIGGDIICDPVGFTGVMPASYFACSTLQSISLTAANPSLLGEYILGYILHDLASDVPGNILATNSQGDFAFIPGIMLTNTDYYVSSVAGLDYDFNGFPDLDHPCTVYAPGTKVVWLDPVHIAVNEICDWAFTGDFSVTLAVSGGLPQYLAGALYVVSGIANNIPLSYGQSANIALGQFDGQTYTISVADEIGCAATFYSAPIVCYKTPIELLNFDGQAFTEYNLLEWTSGSEYENDYYTLERSSDGINFIRITDIAGAGTSIHSHHYSYKDPEAGDISYYRLSWVDYNGRISQSEIIKLERQSASYGVVEIFPIPVQEELIVKLHDGGPEVTIRIFDVAGRKMSENLYAVPQEYIHIGVKNLPIGIYMIQISDGIKSSSSRFIKD